ncbi:MAG: RDD family protein [Candidatus Binatia bacterium]
MAEHINFETPENVQVSYLTAGLGTRFIAWFIDQIFVGLLLFIILICLLVTGTGIASVLGTFASSIQRAQSGQTEELIYYTLGVFTLVLGLGNFFYYGLSEYLMQGQTFGKRVASIRVVKIDGFSLDVGSVFIRNLFRVADHFPPLWVVPLVSGKSQRLGDMIAGTIVVTDESPRMSKLREDLLSRSPEHRVFHFDGATLGRALPSDIEVVEKIIERNASLSDQEKEALLKKVCEPLVKRLRVEPPDPDQRMSFLIDFLAAEFRRQHRELN